MNTLPINTLLESPPKESIGRAPSLSRVTLLESTVRMRERADCPVAMGELLAGKYQLERVVGVGGMGVVVLAWHAELQQRVALKLLRESFAGHAEARERFRREARAAVRISSDHVVRVFDVATLDNGVPYMVMEYLEGQNLRDLLDQVGPLEEHEAAAILLQVCEALAEAHANQIVHRDLKPENVYLTHRPNRPPLVKVLDFGVSKSLAANTVPHLKLTPASMLRGSPAYMSPEQLDSKREFDARSDVWGAGVLLFELLTGQLPFHGETLPQLICAVLSGERRSLEQYRTGTSPAIEAILDRCLAPQPDERFRTVQRFAQALRPLVLAHEDWAARIRPHLVPSAAQAEAYGKAHIVGESCTSDSSFLQATEVDLPSAPTLSCEPTFAAGFAHWPPPQVVRPRPAGPLALPAWSRKLGTPALFAALGGASVAALVVSALVWVGREAPRTSVPHISAASAAQPRTHRAPPPTTRPAAPPLDLGAPDAAGGPPAAAPRTATSHDSAQHGAESKSSVESQRSGAAPSSAPVPARVIPQNGVRSVPALGAPPSPAGDTVPITDFGGRL